MTKAEEILAVDADNFFACWFFAEIVQMGMFANIWFAQTGVL